MSVWVRRHVLAVAVLAALAAACGDDSSVDAPATTATEAAASSAAPTTAAPDAGEPSPATTSPTPAETADPDPTSDPAEIDACGLLTAEDAAAILGVEPIVPSESTASAADVFILGQCLWEWQVPEDVFDIGLVQLYIWDGEEFYGEELLEEGEFERLDIGERGYGAEFLGYDIMFVIDGKTVSLSASGGNNPDGRTVLIDTARRIAAELG